MYLVVEEDPQAVDQVVHQAGAHQVEEEEAHQAVRLLPCYSTWSSRRRWRKTRRESP